MSIGRGTGLVIAAAVLCMVAGVRQHAQAPRPNIIFIQADDLGFGDLSVYGQSRFQTPSIDRLAKDGVRFTDGAEEPFDDLILATGFTPALAPLGDLVRVDPKGFAVRMDRVTSADQSNLYFVGHTYDATGGLYNIGRDAKLAAARIVAAASNAP